MPSLIEQLPNVAETLLDDSVTYSKHHIDSQQLCVTYNFEVLELNPTEDDTFLGERKYFAPSIMAKLNREPLLVHPLTQMLLSLKWNRIGRYVFSFTFLLYLVYIVAMTTLVIFERDA